MTAEEFKAKWLSIFAKNLSEEELIELCVTKQGKYASYLWNIFSRVPCLRGKKAWQEYDKMDKEGAIEIRYDATRGDKETRTLSNNHLTAQRIKKSDIGVGWLVPINEFYVVGKDFAWCYIVTHEDDGRFGPIFCYAPK